MKYKCIKRCFHRDQMFEVGDVLTCNEEMAAALPPYFELIPGQPGAEAAPADASL